MIAEMYYNHRMIEVRRGGGKTYGYDDYDVKETCGLILKGAFCTIHFIHFT